MKMRAVSLLAVLVACVLALLALSACAEPRAHAVGVNQLSVPPPPNSAQLLSRKAMDLVGSAEHSMASLTPAESKLDSRLC
ncbi:hypothetical protein NXY56_002910 [Leishmania guyanensis]